MYRSIGLALLAVLVGCSGEAVPPPASSDQSATAPVAKTETLTGKWTATMPEPDTPAVSWHFREENRPVHPHLRQGHFRENHPQDRPVGRIILYGKIPLNRILLPIPAYNNSCTNSV